MKWEDMARAIPPNCELVIRVPAKDAPMRMGAGIVSFELRENDPLGRRTSAYATPECLDHAAFDVEPALLKDLKRALHVHVEAV